MYKQSNDLRFVKNRTAMQRAFIDLAKEKGYQAVRVKDVTERANVNRMTFYAHYDSLADVVREFTDSIVVEIENRCSSLDRFDVRAFFECASEAMYREIDFFRMVATDESCAFCRTQFRTAFERLLKAELARSSGLEGFRFEVVADMLASGVTYAYLDWLAGKYGDEPLDRLIETFDMMITAVLSGVAMGK